MPPSRPDLDLIALAESRWLLTAEEAERARVECRASGRPADKVLIELKLLDVSQVEMLRALYRETNEVTPSRSTTKVVGGATPGSGSSEGKTAVPLTGAWINRRYEVLREIGRGGMGRVFLVRDTLRDGAVIALKSLRQDKGLWHGPSGFAQEFKTLAGLRHPNVESVFDYGRVDEGPSTEEGGLFFTCEYVEGKDLFAWTAGMTWDRVVPLVVQVCRGLQFIHAHGLIHHDVKPENILVCDTPEGAVVKLVDFGLAGEKETRGGLHVQGTVPYLAPEIIRGEAVDDRSDLYSLGISFYELLTRELPYRGKTSTAVIREHLEAPLPSLRQKAPAVPVEIAELIGRLMAKYPGERCGSGNEVIRQLGRITHVEYPLETKATLKGYVGSGAFLGRDDDLAWIRALWEAVERGDRGPRLGLITGESGIGKSRLLREFRIWAQTHGVQVAEGKAEAPSRRPFALWEELLSKVVRQVEVWEHVGQIASGLVATYAPYLQSVVPEVGERYAPEAPPRLDPRDEQRRLADQVSDFLLRVTQDRGLVLILEDLQWTDEMSLRVAESLARKASMGTLPTRLLVLATRREGEEAPEVDRMIERLTRDGHAQRRSLGPLNRKSQEDLVRTIFGAGADLVLEKVLTADQSGNPHFLEEVLKAWVDQEVLAWRPWGWEIDPERWRTVQVPAGVEEALSARIAHMAPAEREWMEHLAVWGGTARNEELEASFGAGKSSRGPLAEKEGAGGGASVDLRGLVRRGLLREETSDEGILYRFAHSRVAEAVRGGIPEAAWKRMSAHVLHRLAEEVREGRRREGEEAKRLARLACDAGNARSHLKYGLLAARRAEERHALAEAYVDYRGLLELKLEGKTRLEVMEKTADLERITGAGSARESYERLLREIEGIEDGADRRLMGARVRLKMAVVDRLTGRPQEAERGYEEAVKALRKGVTERGSDAERILEAKILLDQAVLAFEIWGDLRRPVALAGRARQIVQSLGAPAREILATSERIFGLVDRRRGDLEAARMHFQRQVDLAAEIHDDLAVATALPDLGSVYYELGRMEEAMGCYERALKLAERMGDKRRLASSLCNVGMVCRRRGDLDRALEMLVRGTAMFEELGDQQRIALNTGNIGRVHYEKGDMESARGCQEKHLRLCKELGDKRGAGMALCDIANILSRQGDLDQALSYNREYLAIGREIGNKVGIGVALTNIGGIHIDRGDLASAMEQYQQALTLFKEMGFKDGIQSAWASIGEVKNDAGDFAGALEAFQRSRAVFENAGEKHEFGMLLCSMAEVRVRRGELAEAASDIQQALQHMQTEEYATELARALTLQGTIRAARGEEAEGMANVERALAMSEQKGYVRERAGAAVVLAEGYRRSGRTDDAIRLAGEAAAFYARSGLRPREAAARVTLAEAWLASGKGPEGIVAARKELETAAGIFAGAEGSGIERIELVRARIHLAEGSFAEAAVAARLALKAIERRAVMSSKIESLTLLGRALQAAGDPIGGAAALDEARQSAARTGFVVLAREIG